MNHNNRNQPEILIDCMLKTTLEGLDLLENPLRLSF